MALEQDGYKANLACFFMIGEGFLAFRTSAFFVMPNVHAFVYNTETVPRRYDSGFLRIIVKFSDILEIIPTDLFCTSNLDLLM